MADKNVDTVIKRRMDQCFKVLKEYSWLLDSYILDFFTESHMKKLPNCWAEQLLKISPEDLGGLIDLTSEKQIRVWPLSLLCLRSFLQYMSLPRCPGNSGINFNRFNENSNFNILSSYRNENNVKFKIKTEISKEYITPCFKHPKLKTLFLKHVKPKKRYEIFRMAEITARSAKQLGVTFLVDVGSGLGHLSRIMAYGFSLTVCCLESQLSLSKQAEKLDAELEVTAGKHLTVIEMEAIKQRRPVHANETVVFHSTVNDFVQRVKTAFGTNDNNFQFGIVGLHPCGNLTSTLLRLFVNSEEIRFINLAGCCYHKLSTIRDSSSDVGFPLSKFSKENYVDLSYESRALACHAIETYCSRLRSRDYDHLKVHCFRAALEKIIKKNWPQHRKSALNNVKHGPELSFADYCKSALRKLELQVPQEDLDSNETLTNLSEWKQVVIYYSLRLMIAPLIETVILLDRVLYLTEHDIKCDLVAAFDPTISPRNHILTAKKLK